MWGRMRAVYLVAVLALVFVLAGCGPVKSTMMINEAESVLDQARAQQADQKVASIYYYWAASEYLIMAKTTHGQAAFFRSEALGQRALELAQKALETAQKGKQKAEDPTLDPPATVDERPDYK